MDNDDEFQSLFSNEEDDGNDETLLPMCFIFPHAIEKKDQEEELQ